MGVERTVLPDRSWAVSGAWAGLCGIASYLLLAFVPTVSAPVAASLSSLFSLGFGLTAIGLYLGVVRATSPRLGLLAAVANTVAGAELLAMLLVQIAVTTRAPHPGAAMTAIWLGLDVAWDVFGAVGTVLLALALWSQRRFRVLAAVGALVGAVLLVLNLGTFPTPPAEAGLVDAGPLCALWYVVVCVWVLVVARSRAEPAPAAGEAAGAAGEHALV